MLPSDKEMVARYYDLCDKRDALYDKAAPLEEKLTAANSRCEAARVEAHGFAEQIDAINIEGGLIAIKKEIGRIARYLQKIPPRA